MLNTPTRRWPMPAAALGVALLLTACAPMSPTAPAPVQAPAAAASLPVDAALRSQT